MHDVLILFMYAFAVACLEMFFQFIMTQGQIFEPYGNWWKRQVRYNRLLSRYGKKRTLVSLLAYISKPMGLCEYCNGTWLAIVAFLYIYGLTPFIFLFIGLVFFFIRIMAYKIKLL